MSGLGKTTNTGRQTSDDRGVLIWAKNTLGSTISAGDPCRLVAADAEGWATQALGGKRGGVSSDDPVIPAFSRSDHSNNGVWFHSSAMYVQNEHVSGGYFSQHMFSELISEEK